MIKPSDCQTGHIYKWNCEHWVRVNPCLRVQDALEAFKSKETTHFVCLGDYRSAIFSDDERFRFEYVGKFNAGISLE